ncbi:hypothetical protein AB2L28_03155 [Kineococcus sp. TBRC 1896]|uniref:O-antigen ligase-like membrane protein n=1 Tax=Kineococcus mangrovi TaxID=1660183 RepID=A0ABV4HZJ9_9ACTN
MTTRLPGRADRWLVPGALVVTIVLVGLLWFGPLAPVAVVGAAVLVVLTVRVPQALVGLTLIVVVFSTPLQAIAGGSASVADDGLVLFCAIALPARRLVVRGGLRWLPGSAWWLAFLAFGLISAVAQDVPNGLALKGAFAAVKGVLFAFAVAQVDWPPGLVRRALLLTLPITAITVFSGAVNLIAPAAWSHIVAGVSTVGPFGLPALVGPFGRPAAFSRFCGVLAVGALAYMLLVRRRPVVMAVFVSCTALAFLTLQVKSLLGLLLTTALLCLPFLTRRRALLVAMLVPAVLLPAAPVVWELASTDFTAYVVQDSARSELTVGGLAVAAATFPLGAGFGRYASSTAADAYSPWYYWLHFDSRYGLAPGPDSGQFLNDSQWPALYGETGWFGAACFVLGLVCLVVALLRGWHSETEPLWRWLRLAGLGWLALLLAESAAAPVFVSAPSYPFVFLAAALLTGAQRAPARVQVPHAR